MNSVQSPGKLDNTYIGSYALDLTWRSDDWRTYEGCFDAYLETYLTDDQATIRNAVFNFTL